MIDSTWERSKAMKNAQPMTVVAKPGQRHPLFLQQRLNEQLFWPSLILIIICIGLLVWNQPAFQQYRLNLMVILLATGFIFILTNFYRLRAYAQCRPEALRLQLPFYHLDIPYRLIRTTRLSELQHMFPLDSLRWTQRAFAEPILARTVVVVELEDLPVPRSSLRLWMSPLMLPPDVIGLVLPVRNWLNFRTELDEYVASLRRMPHLP
jgi:hypothetical protein